MNKSFFSFNYPWRLAVFLGLLSFLVILLIIRVITLSIIHREFLENQGNARAIRTIEIPAYRGLILDRNAHPLAISTPVYAISIDPKKFKPLTQDISLLAHLLNLTPENIYTPHETASFRQFIYLKRHVPPDIAEKIKGLKIKGLRLTREYQRYYPEGEVTAQLLGFTNIDDHGIEGLELAYDNYLHGEPGKKQVIKDLQGNVVSELSLIKNPQPGHSLTLSIDRRLQYVAYNELKQAIEKYNARAGNVIILDVPTGEILALVNYPSYNPNQRSKRDPLSYRNQAVTDVFEPGSTIKPFSILNALENGTSPSTIINTSPGVLKVGSGTVRDLHDEGALSLSRILEVSSNIGVTKLSLALKNPNSLYELLHRVGFGSLTDSQFPGESFGILNPRKNWPPFIIATLSFGYGLSATTLQLVQAYSVFANHGQKKVITFLKHKKNQIIQGKSIISPKISDQVLLMLENVIKNGSGKANIPGYRTAGKTGTVRTLKEHNYDAHSHEALFVGITPVSQPRLVIAVIIKEPKNLAYYGSQVAAPTFSAIAGASLRILNIPPDDPKTLIKETNEIK